MSSKKKYLFLTYTVGGSAGGQLYVSSKIDWLKENGWDVDVYYLDKNPIIIENLKPFKNNYIKQLGFGLPIFNSKERQKVFEKLHIKSGEYDDIIIESSTIELALWGEYFASITGAKHICYLLYETFPKYLSNSIKNLLKFKLSQGLLYGISPKSIPLILPEADGEKTWLKAIGCVRPPKDLPLPKKLSEINRDAYTILSIGRLEKPYILNLFNEIKLFCESIDQPINLIVVGDTKQKKQLQKLRNITDSTKNLTTYYLGEVFPISKKIFELSDVFAGCAGSSRMAYFSGLDTITIDVKDFNAIGILYETTNNTIIRSTDEPPIKISRLLNKVYSEKERRKLKRLNNELIREDKLDFTPHQRLISLEIKDEYFPMESINFRRKSGILYSVLKKIGGFPLVYLFYKVRRSLK